MRCYQVTASRGDEVIATRIAGTNALAKEARDALVEKFELKKKDVAIEGVDVPSQKDALIEFVNGIYEANDITEDDGDE